MTIDKAAPAVSLDAAKTRPYGTPTAKPHSGEAQPEAIAEAPKHQDREYLRTFLAENNISLNFQRDEATGQVIVQMIDNNTGNAIRQLPSEVSLRLSAAFAKIQGQFFEENV